MIIEVNGRKPWKVPVHWRTPSAIWAEGARIAVARNDEFVPRGDIPPVSFRTGIA